MENNDVLQEKDKQFIHNIWEIAEKRKASCNLLQTVQERKLLDFQLSQIHTRGLIHCSANILNKSTISTHREKKNQKNICLCGCKREQGDPLSLFYDLEKLSFLGSGVLLIFFFLKHIRLLIFLCFLIYGSFCLITNLLFFQSNKSIQCKQQIDICTLQDQISYLSIKENELLEIFQSFLGFVMGVVWIFGIKIIAELGKLRNQEIDDNLQSDSDYHILVNNLPYGNCQQTQILKYFEKTWEQTYLENRYLENQTFQNFYHVFRIKSIQLMYNMENCRKLISQIIDFSVKLRNCFENKGQSSKNIVKNQCIADYLMLKEKFHDSWKKLNQMRENFLTNQEERKAISTTCALLEFQTQKSHKKFMKQFSTGMNPIKNTCQPTNNPKFKNQTLQIIRSPEPSDILWKNCQKKFNHYKELLIWIVTAVILYLGYSTIGFIQTRQFFKSIDSLLVTIVLQLLNRLIWFYLSIVVSYEQNNTKTEMIVSSVKKSIIAQSINIIVTPLVALFVNKSELYGPSGLSEMVFNYQFVMLGMMLIYYIFNPFYLGKQLLLAIPLTRKFILSYLCHKVGKYDTFEEIHPVLNLYQGPEFPVAGAYVYINSALFHAMFYSNIQPLILLIVFLNISLFFLIMKYLLFRRCKIPELTNLQIFTYCHSFLYLAPLYYISGHVLFLFLKQKNSNINYIQIFLRLLPQLLLLIFWFIAVLDFFNFFSNITTYIVKELKASKYIEEKIQLVIQQPAFHSRKTYGEFEEFYNWSHIESFYSDSNVNELLEFQNILFQMKDKNVKKKGKKLKKFCESFTLHSILFQTEEKDYDRQIILVNTSEKNKNSKQKIEKIDKKKEKSVFIKAKNSQNLDRTIKIEAMDNSSETSSSFVQENNNKIKFKLKKRMDRKSSKTQHFLEKTKQFIN